MKRLLLANVLLVVGLSAGCSPARFGGGVRIEPDLVFRMQERMPRRGDDGARPFQDEGVDDEGEYYDGAEEGKSVFVGTLLAFFPGIFVHGLGHTYAGDQQSARRLREMGEWGYILTAIGGGLVVGGVALDDSSSDIVPTSLYVSGGTIGGIGLGFFLMAWFLDMYDTPRAVRSGGRPWRFLEKEGQLFGD